MKYGMKVLVADDDSFNRKIFQKLLERLGNTCEAASDGKEAVDKISTGTYDVIFLDINMPGYTGIECAEIARKDCTGEVCPFLVGVSADEAEDFSIFDASMPKPFAVDNVREILDRVQNGK
jgi:CheY-like chemotaxis protein